MWVISFPVTPPPPAHTLGSLPNLQILPVFVTSSPLLLLLLPPRRLPHTSLPVELPSGCLQFSVFIFGFQQFEKYVTFFFSKLFILLVLL